MSDNQTPMTDAYARSNPTAERWEWIAKCEEFEIELAAALKRNKRLEEALDQITKEVPVHDGYGGLFWPMFDGDGNEIGVQSVDPLTVIGSMHARALDALCGEEAKDAKP